MPGLLLDTPGINDLFADAAAAHTALLQRIDDLRTGCCSKRIAWGKLGCIASISADGRGVDVRNLTSDPTTGTWKLSNPSPVPLVTNTHQGQQIAHLSWSHLGSDLAVVDVLGRVSIFTVYISIDRLNRARAAVKDTESDLERESDSDLDTLVGLWWLNLSRKYMVCKPVVKDSDTGEYRYSAQGYDPYGPFNPVAARAACIGLTRSGVVKLWYGQDQSHFNDAHCELESVVSSDDLFTHAAFCADKDNTVMVVAFTQSRQLKVYKILVNWSPANQQIQGVGLAKSQPQLPPSASLSVQKVKIDDLATPNAAAEDDITGAQLALVELLPPLPTPPGIDSFPTIFAVYTTSSMQPQSIICQWEVRTAMVTGHPSFEGTGSGGETEAFELRRLPDVFIHKCAVSAMQLLSGTMVSLSFSDGTVELRDRTTMKPPPVRENNDMLINMVHAGFSFPTLESYVDMGLSPNYAVAAMVTHTGAVKVVAMKYEADLQLITNKNDPALHSACAALAQQHSYSCNNHLNNDDLLMVAQQCKTRPFITGFLTESHRALGLNMDFLSEVNNEKLLRNNSLQRCMSLQNALDFQGEHNVKPLAAQNASITLHLKMAAVGFAYFMNNVARPPQGMPNGGRIPEQDSKAGALQSLLGVIRWETDLHAYLTDELLDLARKTRGSYDNMEVVSAAIIASNSCALPLSLASASRWLLRYNLRALRGFDQTARDQLSIPQLDEDQRAAFQSLRAILDGSPLKLGVFERMLSDVDGSIKSIMKNVPDATRTTIERDIFLTGAIPPALAPVVTRLLSVSLSTLWNDIDPSAIFFYDTTWLALERKKRGMVIDTLRKVVLKGDVKVRRCMRCCERVEDLVPNRAMGIWLQSVSRTCVCGSLWMHD